MDRKKVINILKFYKEIDEEIVMYRCFIQEIEKQYYNNMHPVENIGWAKRQYLISKSTENIEINIPDYAEKEIKDYKKNIYELKSLKEQILQEVSKLNLKAKKVILGYYIYGMTWEQVARQNYYTIRHCRNIRNKAVIELVEKFQNNDFIRNFEQN